jgi:hypothetical protein
MRPAIDPLADEYINGSQSCRIIGCTASSLNRAVVFGHIRVKLVPGMPPAYHRGDVEQFARTKSKSRAQPVEAAAVAD